MNKKPEIGRYPDYGTRGKSEESPIGSHRGPRMGWRMAAAASGLVALSAVAGIASLLAGAFLLLPLAIIAIPFVMRRSRNRRSGSLFAKRSAGFRF